MRHLPDFEPFPNHLIDDMHKAFDVVCAKLRLTPQSDKATALVVTRSLIWPRQAGEGTILLTRPCGSSNPSD
jgi:hypothetical protein